METVFVVVVVAFAPSVNKAAPAHLTNRMHSFLDVVPTYSTEQTKRILMYLIKGVWNQVVPQLNNIK